MLNDRRERNDEHVPPPLNQSATIFLALQEQINAVHQAIQKMTGNKSSNMEYDHRKGTHFIARITATENT